MNTNQLKIFATKAREILRRGVFQKLIWLGFDDHGRIVEKFRPQIFQGGTTWRGEIYPESFGRQWEALAARFERQGINEVVEEGAYTWFNRLMAIRILAKNGLCEPVLEYADTGAPILIEDARNGRFPQMKEERRQQLRDIMERGNDNEAVFALLITEWCRNNPIIHSCFDSIDETVELLLPNDMLGKGGFLELLNTTIHLSEEDFRSSELIGWLYQFYISVKKDEVFAKKGAYEPEDIPAATQIFTPNWIVKYMLQNAVLPQLGIEEGEYLVKNESAPKAPRFTSRQLEGLKIADLACGSGHILGEAFDLLYDLYLEEAYMPDEAVACIFRHNLLGIDIDLRAQQLAKFALMLKAAQHDREFADRPIEPRVLTIPDFVDILNSSKYADENGSRFRPLKHEFFRNSVTDLVVKETEATFDTLKDARSLGSIMKFDISPSTRRAIADTVAYWRGIDPIDRPEFVNDFLPATDLIMALTDSYDAIVMNPPYMATSKEPALKSYATKNYPDSKADLFAIFMDVCIDRLKEDGKYGMINMQSWMFLSSFEALRKKVISKQHIDSLLHLGPRTFDELSGEVVQNAAFVMSKRQSNADGQYFRLVDFKSCGLKETNFANIINAIHCYPEEDYSKMSTNLSRYYYHIQQTGFDIIPGTTIGYWITRPLATAFKGTLIGDFAEPRVGMATADNDKFIRLWTEVNFNKIGLNYPNREEAQASNLKWFPFTKGGSFRKWFGNNEYVVNWHLDGAEIRNFTDPVTGRIRSHNYNLDYIFQPALTWGTIASGRPSFRYCPEGFLYSNSGYGMFFSQTELMPETLALLNCPVSSSVLSMLSPGIGIESGYVRKIPVIQLKNNVDNIVRRSISISKQDWDAHETSWDFQTNPMIAAKEICGGNGTDLDALSEEDRKDILADMDIPTDPNKLEDCYKAYCNHWTRQFHKLHRNEEELNRRFIEIYGLQDELTPSVPLDEVTILQQGEIKITDQYPLETEDGALLTTEKDEVLTVNGDEHMEFQADVVMKQLISYMVGVWMGRYRLDRPGLNIAHPEPTDEELSPYTYGSEQETLVIDDDAIIPILPKDSPFEDNLANRIDDFVRIVWGRDTMNENLNFIEHSLGKSIDDYVQKDFWKDHKKMYSNRPIYWLFSSKKGAFKVLVYAHRMNKHTVSKIRSNYLLKYIKWLEDKVTSMEARAQQLSTRERKDLDRARKSLDECHEYHNRLQQVAESEITFDLDDGILHNYALFGDVLTKL